MRECIAGELRVADSVLAAAVDSLKVRAAVPALVDSAQIAWVAYRRAHCAVAGSAFEGGTMQPLELLGCMTSEAEKRTAAVKALFREPQCSFGSKPGAG